MDYAASKYCIIWGNSCTPNNCFLETNIRMNTLSTKTCFLKLNMDTPLASNLFKTATSFLYPSAKFNLF